MLANPKRFSKTCFDSLKSPFSDADVKLIYNMIIIEKKIGIF